MVVVLVGDQDGVEVVDVFAEHLLPEIRPDVNEDVQMFLTIQGSTAQALVARVCGAAHRTGTTNDRNALRRAGTEQG
jgi:hypothetical protein